MWICICEYITVTPVQRGYRFIRQPLPTVLSLFGWGIEIFDRASFFRLRVKQSCYSPSWVCFFRQTSWYAVLPTGFRIRQLMTRWRLHEEKESQRHGYRKIPLILLSMLQLFPGAVSETRRREVGFFLQQTRKYQLFEKSSSTLQEGMSSAHNNRKPQRPWYNLELNPEDLVQSQ